MLTLIWVVVIGTVSSFTLLGWIVANSECSYSTLQDESRKRPMIPPYESLNKLVRTESGLDLWQTPEGDIWTVRRDVFLPFMMVEQFMDVYEPPGHGIQPGDIVLDCGANIGIFTKKALARGAKQVISVEPSPPTLEAFRRNFAAEISSGRVIVVPKGVWNQDGELELSLTDNNGALNSLVMNRPAASHKVRVPLTTIDKIVADLGIQRIDFIKMDIEGSEKPALTGGRETIRRFRPRMSISSEHLADDFTAIPALVNSIDPGYKVRGCDCVNQRAGQSFKAQVLAFDPQ